MRIVLLLLTENILPSVRHGIRLWFWKASFKEIAWRGMACAKEKTPLRMQMFPHACQERFLVRSRQKVLKGIAQHVNKGKLLLQVERARICHHPLNRDSLRMSLLGSPCDHLWDDIHPGDLEAKLRHANSHRSGTTREIKQRSTKLAGHLLGQGIIRIVASLFHVIVLRVSIPFKIP